VTGREPVTPNLLGVGRVDPTVPGQPWWRYRRGVAEPWRDVALGARRTAAASPASTPPPAPPAPGTLGGDHPSLAHERPVEVVVAESRSPLPFVVGGLALLAVLAYAARLGTTSLGSFVIPVAGMLLAYAAAIWQTRAHPDEPWIGRWLLAGVGFKLLACYLRYLTLIVGYENRQQGGDANRYHQTGRELALFWMHKGPDPGLANFRRTNFVNWFDGITQYLFGWDFLAGFFVFGLLAAAGSYMWYRAAADTVPILDKKLFFIFVMFAPSVVFWPASIGKEALMQLGIGAMSLGLARLLTRRLLVGLAIVAAGGWFVWVVRPHLLAIVAVSGGFAYLVGRVRADRGGVVLSRPIGIIVVAVLVGFTVSQGASYLGLKDFSLNSVETTLNEQTARTATGGSQFDPGSNSLSPIHLPQRVVNVLLRPFPWEVATGFQLLASLESALLVALMILRFSSLRAALRHSRTMPFLLYAWVMTLLYCMAYAAFANFGLLVRQRSLVFPAVLLLIAVDPLLARRMEAEDRRDALGPDLASVDERS
jgi:hypothetical protein